MGTRRVFVKDKTVLVEVQALGVTSDWYNSPMALYVDNWETLDTVTKTSITNLVLASSYTFDHDEQV